MTDGEEGTGPQGSTERGGKKFFILSFNPKGGKNVEAGRQKPQKTES